MIDTYNFFITNEFMDGEARSQFSLLFLSLFFFLFFHCFRRNLSLLKELLRLDDDLHIEQNFQPIWQDETNSKVKKQKLVKANKTTLMG